MGGGKRLCRDLRGEGSTPFSLWSGLWGYVVLEGPVMPEPRFICSKKIYRAFANARYCGDAVLCIGVLGALKETRALLLREGKSSHESFSAGRILPGWVYCSGHFDWMELCTKLSQLRLPLLLASLWLLGWDTHLCAHHLWLR